MDGIRVYYAKQKKTLNIRVHVKISFPGGFFVLFTIITHFYLFP